MEELLHGELLTEEQKVELKDIIDKADAYDTLFAEAKKLEKALDVMAAQYGKMYAALVLNKIED